MTQPQPIPSPPSTQGVPDTGTRPTAAPSAPASPQTQPGGTSLGDRVGDALSGATDALNPFSGAVDAVEAVRAWVTRRHNWVRVAWVIGGVNMFAIGVLMLAGRPAAKAAGTAVQLVIPGGKAVKAASAVASAAKSTGKATSS